MDRLGVCVMGISTLRSKRGGTLTSNEHTVVYSRGQQNERGVGVILDQEWAKILLGFCAISDRVILVILKWSPLNLSLIQVYAPASKSDDEVVETFYEDIEKAYKLCKSHEIWIIIAKLVKKEMSVVGPYRIGDQNDRGDKSVDWCKLNKQVITNTWFQQPDRRKWMWVSPDGNTRNQINYITINHHFRNTVSLPSKYRIDSNFLHLRETLNRIL